MRRLLSGKVTSIVALPRLFIDTQQGAINVLRFRITILDFQKHQVQMSGRAWWIRALASAPDIGDGLPRSNDVARLDQHCSIVRVVKQTFLSRNVNVEVFAAAQFAAAFPLGSVSDDDAVSDAHNIDRLAGDIILFILILVVNENVVRRMAGVPVVIEIIITADAVAAAVYSADCVQAVTC